MTMQMLSVHWLYSETHIPLSVKTEYLDGIELVHDSLKQFAADKSMETYPFVEKDDEDNRLAEVSTYMLERVKKLPCFDEVKTLKKLPPIVIVKEVHTCPNCRAESVKRIIEARNGRIILGTESLYENETPPVEEVEDGEYYTKLLNDVPQSGKNGFGIDGVFSRWMRDLNKALLYTSFFDPKEVVPSKRLLAPMPPEALNNLHDHFLNLTWMSLFGSGREISEDYMEELFKDEKYSGIKKALLRIKERIVAKVQKKEKIGGTVFQTVTAEELKGLSYASWKDFYEALAKKIYKDIVKDADQNDPSVLPPVMRDIFNQENFSASDFRFLQQAFELPVRTANFVESILENYCKNLKSQLPLVVQMGTDHAEAAKYMLLKSFKELPIDISLENDSRKFGTMTVDEKKLDLEKSFEQIEKVLDK